MDRAYEHFQLLLEKLPTQFDMDSVNRKNIFFTIFVAFFFYGGWSFIAKCYKAHQIRKMLRKIPNKPSVFTGNLTDVRLLYLFLK